VTRPPVPETVPASLPREDRHPGGPLSFLRPALRGGAGPGGLQLLAGWLAFSLSTSVLWAMHLRSLTGWSALPSYWGEMLTARDLWELAVNGGLAQRWTGPWTPLAAGAALVWFLWSGWRHQAAAAGLPGRLGPWLWGLADALAIGAVPLGILAGLLLWGLGRLGGTGVQALGWLDWVGSGLVRLAFGSALVVQWWLCRLDRAARRSGFRMGSWRRLAAHLGLCFLRFWTWPGQWLGLVLAGVLVRGGLSFAALALGWRLGGASIPRVWVCLLLDLAAVAANAWLLGWFLRLAGMFMRPEGVAGNEGKGAVPAELAVVENANAGIMP